MRNSSPLPRKRLLALCALALITFVPRAGLGQAAPAINQQPQSQTNVPGSDATFTVVATGQAPLAYQWLLNGIYLTNSAHLGGVTDATLTVSNVALGDAGSYQVMVSNQHGSVTSSNATLTVGLPPAITAQPESQIRLLGETATFSAGVTGTPPFSCQWFLNDAPLSDSGRISGATNTSLTITDLQLADAGTYVEVISNAYGTATSSNAVLTVVPRPVCVTAPGD